MFHYFVLKMLHFLNFRLVCSTFGRFLSILSRQPCRHLQVFLRKKAIHSSEYFSEVVEGSVKAVNKELVLDSTCLPFDTCADQVTRSQRKKDCAVIGECMKFDVFKGKV